MKKYLLIFIVATIIGCDDPKPRKPIKVKTGSYLKESVERNKKLLTMEEELIKQIIEKDSIHYYQSSASGSWFYYEIKNDTATYFPKTDDLVTLNYNTIGFKNDTIYSEEEIGTIIYKVDKQELFPGLRNSIKTLKQGEKATFLYPSSFAYGYHGDNNKIGPNIPLKSTLTILNIEKHKDSIKN